MGFKSKFAKVCFWAIFVYVNFTWLAGLLPQDPLFILFDYLSDIYWIALHTPYGVGARIIPLVIIFLFDYLVIWWFYKLLKK